MNFDPQKFFIGLMDFFSILLPGAILTYLMMGDIGPVLLGVNKYCNLAGAEGWAAFLLSSYLFGHLLFLIGSWLDVFPYDWLLRRYSLKQQIIRLAHRGTLLPRLARALIWTVFKGDRDQAVDCVKWIKKQTLKGINADETVNVFQWSKAFLAKELPGSLASIQRFEADSKFFRSFVILLVVLVAMWLMHSQWLLAFVGAILMLPALWRYMDQRFKATNQALWSVISLTAQNGKLSFDRPDTAESSPTHAGGVVYREQDGQVKYLLVEAKKNPDEWLLPKGHIEVGESPRETAVREVQEETGVWAKIHKELMPFVSYSIDGTLVKVQFYLMEYVDHGWKSREDFNREHCWLSHEEALEKRSPDSVKELLRLIGAMRTEYDNGKPSTG